MENLKNLSKSELQSIWSKYFKTAPPPNAHKDYLLKHIYWQQQANIYGDISKKTKNKIAKLMKKLCDGANLIPEHDITIKSGTKLLREYKGVKHEVIVEGDKYKYRGKIYNSLSKIAREITGTQWNGKLFFGVKK